MLINFKDRLTFFLRTDYFFSFLLLILFLVTNGYKYAWDDQHLEIPLLKSLIDPSLYVGDYYVDSLKVNYLSYFYPILAKCISISQIPAAYFFLYLISRYFMFYWIFKLWNLITQRRGIAFFSVAMFILVVRVPEFLYRTFSHQEFALGLVLAGIYFFYKERYILAAAIFGICVNIHALYSLFPMLYMLVYLCIFPPKKGIKERTKAIFQSGIAFFLCALPFFIWVAKKYLTKEHPNPELFDNWYDLYTTTCSQNFVFLDIPIHLVLKKMTIFLLATQRYWFVFSLCLLNFVHTDLFRKDKKVLSVILTSFVLLLVTFYFNYIHPSRFVLDLNLVRNLQYVLLFLTGYTTLLVFEKAEKGPAVLNIVLGFMFILLSFGDMIGTYAALIMLVSISLEKTFQMERDKKRWAYIILLLLILTALVISLGWTFSTSKYKWPTLSKYVFCFGLLVLVALISKIKKFKYESSLKYLFIIIPLSLMCIYYVQFHVRHLKAIKEGIGFWQLQKDWEDMQKYVRDNTPKDSLFLVPYDMEMGGFRIQSNRKVLVCYRDCGIVGFDYKAAVEWKNRIADIEAFKVILDRPLNSAVMNALLKYKVDYIVFPTYYAPKENNPTLSRIYSNDLFVLFKVGRTLNQ